MSSLIFLDEKQIASAIDNAQRGIEQYLEIMRLFPLVNVAYDRDFQRKYNAFYRVRQQKEKWYGVYYEFMECQKGLEVTFSKALRYFLDQNGRYDPSFSSKLVATHNADMPVWDRHVLSNIGYRAPYNNIKDRFNRTVALYHTIQEWYQKFERSNEGGMIIRMFNERVRESKLITNTKKIDFVLWQART